MNSARSATGNTCDNKKRKYYQEVRKLSELIRAIETIIWFGSTPVNAYKLQNHAIEKRLSVTGVSESLGYSKEWFGRLPNQGVKQFKSLQADGFTGWETEVSVPRHGQRGSSIAKTISLRDFNKLLAYEAIKKKNIKAIILLVALSEAGLERVVNDAFAGVSLDWFAEKIVHYTQWTYEEFEEVLQYNREEIKALYSWGSDPADDDWDLAYRINNSFNIPPSI